MSAKDDDAVLTQLATAWVDLYLVGAGLPGCPCCPVHASLNFAAAVTGVNIMPVLVSPPHCFQGGAKINEALVIFEELQDKYSATVGHDKHSCWACPRVSGSRVVCQLMLVALF